MLPIPFKWLEFAFEYFESHSNGSNFIRMLRNPFECFEFWFEFAFECFEYICIRMHSNESLSNGSNLHLNASKPFRMVRICIWMLRIPFEWLEFAFECFHFRMLLICIRMLWIPFECFEFVFECFESLSNGSNLHLNASNTFRIVSNCIGMLRIPFEWFEYAFQC